MLRHGQGGEEAGKGKEDFFVSLHFNGGGGGGGGETGKFFLFFGFPSRRTSSLHLLFEEPEEEGRKGIRNKRMWVLPRAESRVSIV